MLLRLGRKQIALYGFFCFSGWLLYRYHELDINGKLETAQRTMVERRQEDNRDASQILARTLKTNTAADIHEANFSSTHKRTKKRKLILLYTTFFGGPWYLRWNNKFPCKMIQCTFTYKKSLLHEADAIVFHDADILGKMPRRTRSDQLWIYFNLESPLNSKTRGAIYNAVFNWTMSYRVGSDVFTPYGNFRPLQCNEQKRTSEETSLHFATEKTKLIAWIVSACHVPSGRFEYAKKLAQYVTVDIFGGCGNLTCVKSGNEYHLSEECKIQLRRYKFYLAFENSLCEDYITEKYWENGLENGVVPIVLGGANYTKLAIPGSYIDVQSFQSVKHLAEYIKYLDGNDKAYKEFFAWKNKYKLETPYMYGCALCTALHSGTKHKVYDNFDEYWSKDKCSGPVNFT